MMIMIIKWLNITLQNEVSKIGISTFSKDHFTKTPRNPAAVFIAWPVSTCSFTYLFISLIGSNLITAANFCLNGKFAVVGTYDGRCIFYETEVRWVWLFFCVANTVCFHWSKGLEILGHTRLTVDVWTHLAWNSHGSLMFLKVC